MKDKDFETTTLWLVLFHILLYGGGRQGWVSKLSRVITRHPCGRELNPPSVDHKSDIRTSHCCAGLLVASVPSCLNFVCRAATALLNFYLFLAFSLSRVLFRLISSNVADCIISRCKEVTTSVPYVA